MKFSKTVLTVLVLAALPLTALATNFIGGGGSWGVESNWTAGLPTLGTDANFYGQSGTIEAGTDAVARNVYLSMNNGANVTLTMNGGTLTTANQLNIAQSANTTGTFTLNAGSVNVGSNLMVGLRGIGYLNVTEGNAIDAGRMVQVGHTANGGTGTATIAGTLIVRAAGDLGVTSIAIQNGGVLDIVDSGKMLVFGDKQVPLSNLLDGRLTGNGSSDNIVMNTVVFEGETFTQVTAVPEPAAMTLMAAGIAVLFSRRK
jgi:hypothetical protein